MRTTFIIQALVVSFISLGFGLLVRDLLNDLEFQSFQAAEVVMIDTANLLASELEAGAASNPDGSVSLPVAALDGMFQRARSRNPAAQVFHLEVHSIQSQAYVTDSDGIVLWDSENNRRKGMNFSRFRDVALTLSGQYGARSTKSDPKDKSSSILHVAAPIRHQDRIAGVVTVMLPQAVFFPFIEARVKRTIGSAALIGTGVVVLSIAVFFWLLRPIRRLTTYAQAIRDGRRVPLPPLGSSREARTLGTAMEEMREKLEGRAYAEKYVQTLTHELKSPLAAIRGAGELLQEDLPPERRTRFVDNILRESDRAAALIHRLLELSRLENRTSIQDPSPLDPSALLADAVTDARARADAAGLTLALELPPAPSPTIRGEHFALATALRNLLENAIAFAPPGSSIECALACANGRARFTIRDHGPGMPDYAPPRVFDHFYSLRHLHNGHKGSGLGLTYVREAAALHGGTATLANHPDGGCVATIDLPTSP